MFSLQACASSVDILTTQLPLCPAIKSFYRDAVRCYTQALVLESGPRLSSWLLALPAPKQCCYGHLSVFACIPEDPEHIRSPQVRQLVAALKVNSAMRLATRERTPTAAAASLADTVRHSPQRKATFLAEDGAVALIELLTSRKPDVRRHLTCPFERKHRVVMRCWTNITCGSRSNHLGCSLRTCTCGALKQLDRWTTSHASGASSLCVWSHGLQ